MKDTKKFLKEIKLVVFDLDGTLLNDKNKISATTIELVKKLKEKGVKFSIASGRLLSSFVEHIKLLDIDIPIISLDGAYVANPITNQILFESLMKENHVKRALNLSEKYTLNVALCCHDAIHYTENNSIIKSFVDKYGADFRLIKSYHDCVDKVLEIIMVSEFSNKIRKVHSKMIFPYTFGVQTSYYKSNNHGGIYYLELRKMGSNKGKGLKKLCNYLQINLKETAVIGDWYNDVPLFHSKAYKVAMANAVPEIKKIANLITSKDNNEEGINEFLYLLLETKS
ncbi:MAG: Cof-type HAD-IIB family hydrolase [Melioribacter sp.]|uniref:Cof-type HAD-IIB family hydrolase n=1 Tax=Rosettibacter primus TaxID=3111523 RepID=UPI00247CFF67|nr:Cof-type HAD-IIB family hydrolase [Melioribacter sp.]